MKTGQQPRYIFVVTGSKNYIKSSPSKGGHSYTTLQYQNKSSSNNIENRGK